MATRTQEIKNMRLISHHDLNGFGDLGEGIALHRTSDGRRIFYMAHVGPPKDITSVDVTDIAIGISAPPVQLPVHRGGHHAGGLPIDWT